MSQKNEKENLAGKIAKLDCELQQQRTNAENCHQKFITSEAKYRNKLDELSVELEITTQTNIELQKKVCIFLTVVRTNALKGNIM